MAFDINAIKAAAAKLQQAQQTKAQPKSEPKRTTTRASKPTAKVTTSAPKSAPKTDTKKRTNECAYVIPASFKERIESYLYSRPDIVPKLNAKDKSIDGCCEFIYAKFLNEAKKARNGKQAVGMSPSDDEVYGLAVHYYDEPNEMLKKELEDEA